MTDHDFKIIIISIIWLWVGIITGWIGRGSFLNKKEKVKNEN